ncbi:C10 family peptidase [Pontiella sp.]|uniref:C10 family peptidase n=1 Tax=Pontiella sp. TaxID=2837462 RepID=UPI003563FD55
MKKWIWAVWGLAAAQAMGAAMTQEEALERALDWMDGNPVMSQAGRDVETVTVFPDTGSYSVYVVQLEPKGFLILNSDDRLPLTVSFSADSMVNLEDDPQNAMRSMLLGYCEEQAEALANWSAAPMAGRLAALTSGDELHGPFMDTSWDQEEPYNNFCPSDAVVGCVPVTIGQLMNYHRWPYHGSGSRSYTDITGSNTGTHSAVFSDPFDWDQMRSAHSTADTQAEQDAIAELMFELGVAAGLDYEYDLTSGNAQALASSLGEYGFYRSVEVFSTAGGDDIITPLEAELRAGFPCVVAFPGHAFVADGLMVDGGVTTYHFNMGWGGYNNGWYASDAAPTGSGSAELDECITSFRPQLIAFPQTNAVSAGAGETTELHWILPRRLEDDVAALTIKQLEQQAGSWSSDASEISGLSAGWEVVGGGRSGDCWYGGPYGTCSMVLNEVFVPDASAQLSFWMQYVLYDADDIFKVSVSTNNGASYATVFSATTDTQYSWSHETVSLAAYAGQQIRLKFTVRVDDLYYTSGGVWLDDLAVTSGEWFDWTLFAEDTTLASRRFTEVTTLWDDCADFSVFEETKSDPSADWVVSTSEGVDHCFYKAAPTAWNYGCHLTSYSTITPTSATRLIVNAKYSLASSGNAEYFKILVSTDRLAFTEIWSASGTADWSDITLDLSAYAGQPVYVRLEYTFSGSYIPGGGIWIDSIRTQEVTHPELEGQPIHYTTLSNLTAGTHTLAAVLTDTNAVEHAVGPLFSLTVEATDDGDGMPEAWELQYGLDTENDDSGLDPDGDGFTHMQEYISGTVPTNGASFWALTAGSGPLPAFQGLEDRRYAIEYCDGLVSNGWNILATDIVGSNGLFEVEQYETATNAVRFYRVKVWMP